jgi:hypothetical protein
VVSFAITALGEREPNITNWVGGRRLILSNDTDTTYDVDLSGRGVLVIRSTLTLGTTGAYQHTLRSTGSGGIVIANTGALLLNESELPTAISIKVNGWLSTNGKIATLAIPANVDLSAATLIADPITPGSGVSTFTFGPRAVTINTIELTDTPLTIAGKVEGGLSSIVNLTVKTITNSVLFAPAADTLVTLPAGTTTVDRIIPTAEDITIGGSAHTILSPLTITAGEVRLVSPGLVLSGPIELATLAELGLAANSNLGSDNEAQLAQLSRIIGGTVEAVGLHFNFTGGTYYFNLNTTGDLKISGAVTFGAPNALIEARSLYALDGPSPAVINGKARIILDGNLFVSDDITFNNTGGVLLTGNANTIANGKSIIVGPGVQVEFYDGVAPVGTHLVLAQGAYTARNQLTINAVAGTITTPAAGGAVGDGLTIAPVPGDANAITLLADTSGQATFTAVAGNTGTGAPVVLSGSGITVPSDSTAGASFTISGTATAAGAVTVKGTSDITLETDATAGNRGRLVLTVGAKIGGGESPTYYTAATGGTFTASAAFDSQATTNVINGADGTGVVVLTAQSPTVDGIFTSATAQR